MGVMLFIIIHQRNKQKEMRLLQEQQKANEEIYQLIQNQQTKLMKEGKLKRNVSPKIYTMES